MTDPLKMNCAHSADGWCLACVAAFAAAPPVEPAEAPGMVMLTEEEVELCVLDVVRDQARGETLKAYEDRLATYVQRAFAEKNAATVKEPQHDE